MFNKQKSKRQAKGRRHQRIRAKLSGTIEKPRLSVFRSHKHIYAQLVDDIKGQTMFSANDFELKKQKFAKKLVPSMSNKLAIAYNVGQLIAEKSLKNKIKKVVFDRGGYKYHGRIKALAEGARQGGLEF